MSRMKTVAPLLAVLVLAGCTSKPEPPATPTATFSIGPTPTATASPSSVPLTPAVSLTHGSAEVKVTGDIKMKLTLPIGPNGVFQPPPGNFSVSYVGRDGNAVIVGGPTPEATARTSADLTLSLVLQGKVALAFPSSRGECSLTITRSTSAGFEARFRCGSLTSSGKTIQAAGTFLATR
jgi:hypothetical protein